MTSIFAQEYDFPLFSRKIMLSSPAVSGKLFLLLEKDGALYLNKKLLGVGSGCYSLSPEDFSAGGRQLLEILTQGEGRVAYRLECDGPEGKRVFSSSGEEKVRRSQVIASTPLFELWDAALFFTHEKEAPVKTDDSFFTEDAFLSLPAPRKPLFTLPAENSAGLPVTVTYPTAPDVKDTIVCAGEEIFFTPLFAERPAAFSVSRERVQ